MAKEGMMADSHVPTPKPLVQAACVCEKVLIEPDKVPSLIRIVDTYTLAMPVNPPDGFKLAASLTAFVSLKSGDVVGQFEIGLRMTNPEGKTAPVRKWPIELRGNEHGASLKVDFGLEDPKAGLYWFDVLWTEDEVLTRIPFRIKFKSEPNVEQAGPTTDKSSSLQPEPTRSRRL